MSPRLSIHDALERLVMLGRWVRNYWKRVLLFLLLPVSCILVYLGYCSYSVVLGRSQLNEAFDEADRIDPGWRLMDLEQARAIIPDEENSALQVLKVDRLIPKNWWD